MAKTTINDVWKYLYPYQDRKVSQNSLNNLVTEKPKWENLPTKAIRVPEIFRGEIMEFARILDRGNSIKRNTDYSHKDIEQAISILKKSLKLPANRGGAIKQEIRKAIRLLQTEDKH